MIGHQSKTNLWSFKTIGYVILFVFLLVNIILISQLYPLRKHYRIYWEARGWVSNNILRRSPPDPHYFIDNKNIIFQTDEFVLPRSTLQEPYYKVKDLIAIDNIHDFKLYQSNLLESMTQTFALDRIPRGDLNFITHSSEKQLGYKRHKVSYQTQSSVRIPAYILEPTDYDPPWSAVIVVHGCGYGKAGVVGLVDDYHNAIGVDLVQAGFLVLAPDRRGFGESQPVPHYVSPGCGSGAKDGRYLLQADANNVFNTNLRALQVYDLLVAVEYLSERSDIVSVGLAGISGGGLVAEYVAGLSNDIKAVVLAVSLSFRPEDFDSDNSLNIEKEKYFPELVNTPIDYIHNSYFFRDLAFSDFDSKSLIPLALLTSTPVLIQFGDSDSVNYLQGGPAAIEFVRHLYKLNGKEDLVSISIESGTHEFFSGPIIRFFEKNIVQ